MEEGRPQGTVLGPLAWLIFVDDVVHALRPARGEAFLYADDISLLFTGDDPDTLYEQAQQALDLLGPWATANGVVVAPTKSSVTAWAPGDHEPGHPALPLTFESVTVPYEAEVRFLGLRRDDRQTFRAHIEMVTGKVSRCVRMLRRIGGRS